MPFLVRKLIKRDRLSDLSQVEDLNSINADIATTEFRTSEGTLSTWIIDSLEDLKEAVLAIAVTSPEISKLDVIVIDTNLLEENNLEYHQSYAGQDIIVPDLQDTHYDIINITVPKLMTCLKIYQTICKKDPEGENFVVRYAKGEVKDVLKQAISDNRVNAEKAAGKIREAIEKLKAC